MNVKKRILLGAIGGITPYIATLLTINFENVMNGYEFYDWMGLTVRCCVLVFFGSLVAYLHKNEKEPFKVFQLGIAAPALIATMINGNAASDQNIPTKVSFSSYSFSFVAEVYAQDPIINEGLLRQPQVSGSSRFFRGLLGQKIENDHPDRWYVVVGTHETLEQAKKQVTDLEQVNYKAEIYSALGKGDKFSVVIASNVSKEAAQDAKMKALENGLPPGSFLLEH